MCSVTTNIAMLSSPALDKPLLLSSRMPGHTLLNRDDYWKGDVATALAIATLCLEFAYAFPAVVLRIILVGVLTLRAQATTLPALLVCQLYASDFKLGGLLTYEYLLDRHEAARITIFGFPITTNYIFALCLTVNILTRILSRPQVLRGMMPQSTVILWCTCFPIAVVAALANLTGSAVSWTAPIRDSMMVGCVFFGFIIGEDANAIRRVIINRLLPMFFCMITLALFGYFYARGMYWITAAGPSILATKVMMRDRSVSWRFALSFAVLTTAYAYAFYPTAYASQVAKALYSDNATTFALKGMWCGALVLVPIAILLRPRYFDRKSAFATRKPKLELSFAAWGAGLLMLSFPVMLAAISYQVQVELSSKRYSVELPWQEQLLFKLLYDRAPIYRGAIDEVMQPPYLFKAGRRESYRLTLNGDKIPWPAGSHNLVLEQLRRNGWYCGLVSLTIMIGGMMWACTGFLKTKDSFLTWYAGATFITLFISGITSHIPMETNASIWLLTPAGIAAALYRHEVVNS